MQTLRADFEEAAMSFCSTPVQAFFSITLPLLLPGIVADALCLRGISRPVRRLVFSRRRREHAAGRDRPADPQGLYARTNAISTIFLAVSTAPSSSSCNLVESRRKT